MLTIEEELRLRKKGAMSLHLTPDLRLLIERYQQREEIRSEAAAAREIIRAGLLVTGMIPD